MMNLYGWKTPLRSLNPTVNQHHQTISPSATSTQILNTSNVLMSCLMWNRGQGQVPLVLAGSCSITSFLGWCIASSYPHSLPVWSKLSRVLLGCLHWHLKGKSIPDGWEGPARPGVVITYPEPVRGIKSIC